MQSTTDLGAQLRKLRKAKGESLLVAAKSIGIDRSHLNKIELGTFTPSFKLLKQILVHYSVEGNDATVLLQLAGFIPHRVEFVRGRKEADEMADKQPAQPQLAPQISIDPARTPVLYTDAVFVSSSDYGLVLDVAQTLGGQQHNIVARVGMSFEHAKKLVQIMHDHIEKNER